MPKDQSAPSPYGDKNSLTHDELVLLEGKILPTARRWVAMPGLAAHGMQTRTYWGEPFEVPMHYRSVEERERAGL